MAKKENKKEVRAYFCPKCRSTKIKNIFELKNIFGIISQKRCMKCNFSSSVFPIIVLNDKEMKKKNKWKIGGKK